MPRPLSRRKIIRYFPALVGLTAKADRAITGSFVNDAFPIGHQIRYRAPVAQAKSVQRIPVVIVGGGMAGLSAAWRLDKRGFRDFALLEIEREAGGNSRWGQNEVSAYPWAAHYVPIPDAGATFVRELFEEFGVFKNGKWEERYLCFSPQERLFLHGRWQEGIEPDIGTNRKEFDRFEQRVKELHASGEFTIPMDRGKRRMKDLDRLTFAEWAKRENFQSANLLWYLDYACRDDFGARAAQTSAWAGLHYFASRQQEERGPLTWPEGNGWIAKRLIQKLAKYVRTGHGVRSITRQGTKWSIRTTETEWIADRVIFAAPTFLAPYVVEGATRPPIVYSPWLTANLTLDRLPRERGTEPAWDNVIFDSPALGYVVATHMGLQSRTEKTVWTYYWALADGAPAAMRQKLLDTDWGVWKEAILNDLQRAHPDIRECVSRIDMMRIGHAMARPVPGFLDHRPPSIPGVHFAHSDVSGFSIFEEAQYRGVTAADRVLRELGRA